MTVLYVLGLLGVPPALSHSHHRHPVQHRSAAERGGDNLNGFKDFNRNSLKDFYRNSLKEFDLKTFYLKAKARVRPWLSYQVLRTSTLKPFT
jgi:hypothetical protein